MAAAQPAENLIFMMRDIYIDSNQKLLTKFISTAETPSLKISFHGNIYNGHEDDANQ